MKRSGLVYEFRRPLASGAEHHSDAVDRVLAHLAKNPYREDRPIDGRRVEQFVRDHYLALAPWPFAALVE